MAFKMNGWQAHSGSPMKGPRKFLGKIKAGAGKIWESIKNPISNLKDKSINMSNAVGMGSDWVDSQRAYEKKQNEMRQKYLDALRAQVENKKDA